LKETALDRTVWRTHFGIGLWTCHETNCRMMMCLEWITLKD